MGRSYKRDKQRITIPAALVIAVSGDSRSTEESAGLSMAASINTILTHYWMY